MIQQLELRSKNLETELREAVLATQKDCIHLLSPLFKIEPTPVPLPVRLNISEKVGDESGKRIIYVGSLIIYKKKNNNLEILIGVDSEGIVGKSMESVLIASQVTCTHETGHYLHMIKVRGKTKYMGYDGGELIATSSSWIYLKKKELEKKFLMMGLENPYDLTKHEVAFLRMMHKRNSSPEEIVRVAYERPGDIVPEYKDHIAQINDENFEKECRTAIEEST